VQRDSEALVIYRVEGTGCAERLSSFSNIPGGRYRVCRETQKL
jgi:hypothetical protein